MDKINDSSVKKVVTNDNDSQNETDNFMDELPQNVQNALECIAEIKTISTVSRSKRFIKALSMHFSRTKIPEKKSLFYNGFKP